MSISAIDGINSYDYGKCSSYDDSNLTDQFNTGSLQKDVHLKKINPHTLIHKAILENSAEVIRFLLAQGVSVDYADENGMSPLTISILNRCNYAVDVLLEHGANTNPVVGWHHMDLFGIALSMNDTATAKLLFDHGALVRSQDLNKIISFARSDKTTKNYWIEWSKSIIDRGVDMTSTEFCSGPLQSIMHMACDGDLSLLQFTMQKGLNLSIQKNENSPLFIAISRKNLEFVKFLVESGMDVNQRKMNGQTMIHSLEYAVKYGSPEIVQYLLQHGARA